MSVSSMTALASSPPVSRARAEETRNQKNLRLVVSYIPSEAIALYLGGLARISDRTTAGPTLRA